MTTIRGDEIEDCDFMVGPPRHVLPPCRFRLGIVGKLSGAATAVLRMPGNRARIEEMGMTVVGSTPEELGQAMQADGEIFGRAVTQANIRMAK